MTAITMVCGHGDDKNGDDEVAAALMTIMVHLCCWKQVLADNHMRQTFALQ